MAAAAERCAPELQGFRGFAGLQKLDALGKLVRCCSQIEVKRDAGRQIAAEKTGQIEHVRLSVFRRGFLEIDQLAPATEGAIGYWKLEGSQMIGVDRTNQEGPGQLAGNAPLAVTRKIGIGKRLARQAVGFRRSEYRKEQMIDQPWAGSGSEKMAILGHPEGRGGAVQRQAAVRWRALRHQPKIGNAEARPQLMGDRKGPLLICRQRQGLAGKTFIHRRVERNRKGAQRIERSDCLRGRKCGTVDRLDLFEHGGINREGRR